MLSDSPSSEHKISLCLPGKRKTGILIVHGLTANPRSVRSLAEQFNQAGFAVYAPCLPGHGTSPQDLLNVTWEDWLGALEENLTTIKNNHNQIYTVGISMGGNLSFCLAARYPTEITKVISISTPIFLQRHRSITLALPFLSKIKKFHRKKISQEARENRYYEETGSYTVWPYVALKEMIRGIEETKKSLPDISADTLIIHGEEDPLIHPESASFIYQQLPSERKKKVLIPVNGHVPSNGYHVEHIFKEIIDFLDNSENA